MKSIHVDKDGLLRGKTERTFLYKIMPGLSQMLSLEHMRQPLLFSMKWTSI